VTEEEYIKAYSKQYIALDRKDADEVAALEASEGFSFSQTVIDSIVQQPESLISSPISCFHLAVNQHFGKVVLSDATVKYAKNVYKGSIMRIEH
jgi:hypothetical protein